MEKAARFHAGELTAQKKANETAIAARNGANVADTIIRGAFNFIRQQKTLYVGSIDQSGRVWASILIGKPGFLHPSDDASTLTIDLAKVTKQQLDPLWENIRHNNQVGLLLLELTTRRRLKINGEVTLDGDLLHVHVTESVPICPRYIQRRDITLDESSHRNMPVTIKSGRELGEAQCELIKRADTFFLASAHETQGADCSHRGGPNGFVQILQNMVLRIPDYNGNSMFNSFGNLLSNPQAGLVFPDYENLRVLQLNGTAELFWNQPDPTGATGGTNRFWEFKTSNWIETSLPETLRTNFLDFSPFLPGT